MDDIRGISNEFAADGNAASSLGLSNMVWGFGQFLGAPLANLMLSVKLFSVSLPICTHAWCLVFGVLLCMRAAATAYDSHIHNPAAFTPTARLQTTIWL